MLALDFLGVAFAGAMPCGFQMSGVCTPMIRIKAGEPKGLQQRFALQKDRVFAAPEDRRQDGSRAMINGMPQPTRVVFVADKRPHFIHLGWIQRAEQRGVDRLQRWFFLLEFTEDGVRTDVQRSCRIAHPAG